MSEYTREEILKLIEENGGPGGLDLSGKDLSGIDLGREAVEPELEKARERAPEETPVWYSELTEGVDLEGADLREASLYSAQLQRADLWYAKLQGADLDDANLEEAELGCANLQGATLCSANLQGVYLAGADLQGADLRGANLQRAYLRHTNLQRGDLAGASLQEAGLYEAQLEGANLRDADLQGANLWGANLREADLRSCHLEKMDFFRAESLERAYFYDAFLDDTRLKREQLGRGVGTEFERTYNFAKEAYLALKNNFAEIGRYRDESWAYIKERQMGKMMNHPRLARVYYRDELPENPNAWRLGWFYTRHTVKWLADWFVELLCGYGESIWRVLAWMLLVILGFAAYYQVSHAVVTSSQDATTSLWDHLIFSLGAFTTLQPARLQAARPGVELLTTIQAIIGIALAGLLGFVAGNRIRRS